MFQVVAEPGRTGQFDGLRSSVEQRFGTLVDRKPGYLGHPEVTPDDGALLHDSDAHSAAPGLADQVGSGEPADPATDHDDVAWLPAVTHPDTLSARPKPDPVRDSPDAQSAA